MRRRGFTLIELLVASAMALVIGLTVASLFRMVQSMSTSTGSAYQVASDIGEGVRQLRRDLMETALASVRVWHPAADHGTPPGVSMVSARGDDGKFVMGDAAAPQWQRWVVYSLEAEPGALTGNLVRWEKAQPMLLPQVCPLAPNAWAGGAATHRVVLRGVAAPNVTLEGVGTDGSLDTDADGGFDVQFLRLEGRGASYTTSPDNPAKVSTGQAPGLDFTGNTRLVQVRLQMYQVSGTGKASYLELVFRVTPRF